jgi:hypothetical protein
MYRLTALVLPNPVVSSSQRDALFELRSKINREYRCHMMGTSAHEDESKSSRRAIVVEFYVFWIPAFFCKMHRAGAGGGYIKPRPLAHHRMASIDFFSNLQTLFIFTPHVSFFMNILCANAPKPEKSENRDLNR